MWARVTKRDRHARADPATVNRKMQVRSGAVSTVAAERDHVTLGHDVAYIHQRSAGRQVNVIRHRSIRMLDLDKVLMGTCVVRIEEALFYGEYRSAACGNNVGADRHEQIVGESELRPGSMRTAGAIPLADQEARAYLVRQNVRRTRLFRIRSRTALDRRLARVASTAGGQRKRQNADRQDAAKRAAQTAATVLQSFKGNQQAVDSKGNGFRATFLLRCEPKSHHLFMAQRHHGVHARCAPGR